MRIDYGDPVEGPVEAALLSPMEFSAVVRDAPLVCIDLLIRDRHSPMILLGKRNNEPAKGFFFVPGGRIRKNETLKSAFLRILAAETGFLSSFEAAHFVGVFEHFYDVSAVEHIVTRTTTHCVTLCYECLVDGVLLRRDAQHSAFTWFSENDIVRSHDVHANVKAYIR
jgi:colanic acid biosynthesis protein WcaH